MTTPAPILEELTRKDTKLTILFSTVVINWDEVRKSPYVALIGACVGQKISYRQAKSIRKQLYENLGGNYTMVMMKKFLRSDHSSFLSEKDRSLIVRVNKHLETHNLEDVMSLK